jgi:hypothetical protein
MKITQISVFLENRKGRLLEVCSVLGANDINIRGMTIAETESFGVLRIVVDKPEAAVQVLKANNFVANITDVIAVEVDDRPGGLAAVLRVLSDNSEYRIHVRLCGKDRAEGTADLSIRGSGPCTGNPREARHPDRHDERDQRVIGTSGIGCVADDLSLSAARHGGKYSLKWGGVSENSCEIGRPAIMFE